MIYINDKKDCCGCNACGDICPKNAISFESDSEGFWYPKINNEICVNCGLCEKICPMTHVDELKSGCYKEPVVYGGYHKNLSIRFDSTSGGVFSALANSMYKQNGYVSGAIFNEDWSVSNYISNNKKDLVKLRSSKYVQSSAVGLYRQIKDLLNKGEKVLVCGSPCQMAALKSFLQKGYDNLVIVDFLCRATNSPKAYRKYLDYLEDIHGGKIIYIKAKNKDHGWRSLARKVVFDNGKVYYGEGHEDHFRRGYHGNCFERPSCYTCKFKDFPRVSDITLGDFWGIQNVDPTLDGNVGTSLVMLNSKKGELFFESVKGKLEIKKFSLTDLLPGNSDAIKSGRVVYPQINREQMFEDMDKLRFDELACKYFPEYRNRSLVKQCINRVLKFGKEILKHPRISFRTIYFNILKNNIKSDFFKGNFFKVYSHVALDIHKTAIIRCENGIIEWGTKKNKKSKVETALFMDENAQLIFKGPNYFKPDTDIQIFRNATLQFGLGGANMGLKIVCASEITIGDHTYIGRDVWIRDNNGGHIVVQPGYTDSSPIHIGNHVWICSNVQIMKGVTIGDGAVVAGNSVVTCNVPPHCMVAGNPAVVVAENINWIH